MVRTVDPFGEKMDPLKTFEKRLLSGNLIDTSKIKTNRPAWLCPQGVPKLYHDLEAMVTMPLSHSTATSGTSAASPLDTGLVYKLLLASGLSQAVLASLWEQCSRTAPGVLLQHEFYQALALVAICQKGHPPNPALLVNIPQAPLPQFAIAGYPLPLIAPIISPETPVERMHPSIAGGVPTPLRGISLTNSAAAASSVASGDPALHNNSAIASSLDSSCLLNGDQPYMSIKNNWTVSGPSLPSQDDNVATSHLPIVGKTCTSRTTSSVSLNEKMTSAFKQDEKVVDDDDDDFGEFVDFQSAPAGETQQVLPPAARTVDTCKPPVTAPSPVDERLASKSVASYATSALNGSSLLSSDLLTFNSIANGKLTDSMADPFVTDADNSSETSKHGNHHREPQENSGFVSLPKAKSASQTKTTASYPSPAPPTLFPSVLPSLFDSISVQMTEAVQPPTEPNAWLHFPLTSETTALDGQQRQAKKPVQTSEKPPEVQAYSSAINAQSADAKGRAASTDDDFGEFSDFQSAPSVDPGLCAMSIEVNSRPVTEQHLAPNTTDRYSAFRALEPDPSESNVDDGDNTLTMNELHLTNSGPCGVAPTNNSAPAAGLGPPKVDILALMKLPTVPAVSLDDDLSILDSLAISADVEGHSGSALEQLQDIDLGFAVVNGPLSNVDAGISSTPVSPSKSVASGGSIGEPRGDGRLSLFNGRANYSECGSLSSFELGPNTESNGSSPTKGSLLSLELNSPKMTPPEEAADDDDALEWTVNGAPGPGAGAAAPSGFGIDIPPENTKSPDEFCWAQPPMFPPPDPTTDLNKPSAALQDLTEIYLQNYPDTVVQQGRKHLTKEQVAENWVRLLGKVAAVLDTATHILGSDHSVLAEVLATPKGQGYVSSLLEVYNVSQQIKKAATLFGVEGIAGPMEHVEDAWRRQLDDLTVGLGLSVICLDHLRSPLQSSLDTCAVCLLPLALRPRLLFGDHAYHATCANFWANVLAEGLPCLKLD
ncbi:hypothetical protein BIW11_01958 [Tropilaelaps mercedesae]|uniref:EH domain-containing protein n=1 Tax=Tropilaelaps mercedesae TaxID=418985 RepID=A0A1V9X5X1_9ACAR|nr:hypothetical protein BIW11_01958 [Tropilaelaps mercedesae]